MTAITNKENVKDTVDAYNSYIHLALPYVAENPTMSKAQLSQGEIGNWAKIFAKMRENTKETTKDTPKKIDV